MNILFFSHDARLYGASRSLVALIEGLRNQGVMCYLMIPYKGPLIHLLEEKNIAYDCFCYTEWVSEEKAKVIGNSRIAKWLNYKINICRKAYINLRVLPRIAKKAKEWNIDIIYTNTSVIPIGNLLSILLRKPHVWHIREFKDIDYNLTLDWGNYLFGLLLKKSSYVIFISDAVKKHYLKKYIIKKWKVVYNGLFFRNEYDTLYLKRKRKNETKTYIFLSVGFVSKNKGQDIAIEAISILQKYYPNIRLTIVGSGDSNLIRIAIDKFNVKDVVEYVGHSDNPFQYYLSSDAFVTCSLSEAWGRVTAEAMSACLPVIGMNTAGTLEIIEPEHNGLLFNKSAISLANCMKRFIDDPAWANTLGENGWRDAKEKYSIEKYVEEIYQILLQVYPLKDINVESKTTSSTPIIDSL